MIGRCLRKILLLIRQSYQTQCPAGVESITIYLPLIPYDLCDLDLDVASSGLESESRFSHF